MRGMRALSYRVLGRGIDSLWLGGVRSDSEGASAGPSCSRIVATLVCGKTPERGLGAGTCHAQCPGRLIPNGLSRPQTQNVHYNLMCIYVLHDVPEKASTRGDGPVSAGDRLTHTHGVRVAASTVDSPPWRCVAALSWRQSLCRRHTAKAHAPHFLGGGRFGSSRLKGRLRVRT